MTLAPTATLAGRRRIALLLALTLGTAWLNAPVADAVRAAVAAVTAPAAIDPSLTRVDATEVAVVVQATPGGADAAAAAVRAAGGTVGAPLPIIDGFAARIPTAALPTLAVTPGIRAVSKNATGVFSEMSYDEASTASNFTKTTGAQSAWTAGNRGAGVGVAVIDTGISPMRDLTHDLVVGPDLSGEGTVFDSYGHGTVMAGLIGGDGTDSAGRTGGAFLGVAPKSTLVSVKVAGRNGAADVSTLLQAMHWVSAYKDQYNIRVLNLSWGVPSTQSPSVDPINYAVQRLWKQGIVVVVAAGNNGPSAGTILKPADDPLAITAGAYDDKQNTDAADDSIPSWSSRGPTAHGLSKPDLVAPGRLLIASRAYGSAIEAENPKALYAPSYIRGSGTSEAAAVTSGLAALLLAARPELTPDQVKQVLRDSSSPIAGRTAYEQGAGRVNLAKAMTTAAGPATQQSYSASGLGSIDASRGGWYVETDCGEDGVRDLIRGEIDVRCEPWNGGAWTGGAWTGGAWTGGAWTGGAWTGGAWTGGAWTGGAWTGGAWTGGAWTGGAWTGGAWTGGAWTGGAWTGGAWTGAAWTGAAWTGGAWTGGAWTGGAWTSDSYGDDTDVDGISLFTSAFFGPKTKYGDPLPGELMDLPDYSTGTAVQTATKVATY